MKSVRIQNDLSFSWSFFVKIDEERQPYNIEGKDLTVVISNQFDDRIIVPATASGNTAFFSFLGKDQKEAGIYTLTMYMNYQKEGMIALDKISHFRLVDRQNTVMLESCCSGCGSAEELLSMESEIDMYTSSDYDLLNNKPKINGVVLEGDKQLSEFGMASVEDLAEENARAIREEQANANAIQAERYRAEDAESVLGQAIISEKQRATLSEEGLAGSINTESERAQRAEAGLSLGISTETGRATEAEKNLSERIDKVTHPYVSLERIRKYLYRVTFDTLPEDDDSYEPVVTGCSSFVQDGNLYTNLDWDYDNTASFIVRTRDFEGQSFIKGLEDKNLDDALIAQLPYRVHRGVNDYGISLASHILFNDWGWTGCGNRTINLTRLPFLILSKVKSMDTIAQDLDGVLNNLYCPGGLTELGYLLQVIVTDGVSTYAIIPPSSENESYQIVNATEFPKMANFRYIARAAVSRSDSDLQRRPTGIERWNAMPCELKDLRFTKAYEAPDRLSEFIGLRDTTKESSDAELMAIYEAARAEYLRRKRDGKTWHTMESAIYGDWLESLWIQENFDDDCSPKVDEATDEDIDSLFTNLITT